MYCLCRSVYCLCVNVYCTTATGWLPNYSQQIYHHIFLWMGETSDRPEPIHTDDVKGRFHRKRDEFLPKKARRQNLGNNNPCQNSGTYYMYRPIVSAGRGLLQTAVYAIRL